MLLRVIVGPSGLEPGFTILDRSDAGALIALVRSQLGLNEKDKRFPRKGTIAEIFSKSRRTRCAAWMTLSSRSSAILPIISTRFRQLQTGYRAAKRQRQLADYDVSLLVLLRQLLMQDTQARQSIRDCIDAFWSTNIKIPIDCRRT